MKKAIFFDIDGTLLNSFEGMNTISPAVKESIKNFQKDNNNVYIATGRPYAFLCNDILDFGFDGFILMNGSLILNKDKKPVYKHIFNKKIIKELIKTFDKYNIEYILQDVKYSYTKKEFKSLMKLYENIGINDKYIKTDFNLDEIDVYKIEMYCESDESINYCKTLSNDDYRYVYYDKFRLFELYSRKNSKATAILKILDFLNIDIKNSYAFGDGKNDIEMLKTVGCGIAMGNAASEIKNHADKVTLSVAKDGISFGIENFIKS